MDNNASDINESNSDNADDNADDNTDNNNYKDDNYDATTMTAVATMLLVLP